MEFLNILPSLPTWAWISITIFLIFNFIFITIFENDDDEDFVLYTNYTVLGILITLLIACWSKLGDIWNTILINKWIACGVIISYVLIGLIWSMIKWRFFVSSDMKYRKNFGLKIEIENYSIEKNKVRIRFWMIYWVNSMLSQLLHKFLFKAFETILNITKKYYENVVNSLYNKINNNTKN